jgi:SSS family solute:Na+ symporter
MLGAFLLGVMSRRANQTGVMTGMAVSLAFMLLVKIYTSIAWTWYVLMGTVVCLAVGYTVSRLTRPSLQAVEEPERVGVAND